MGFIRQKYDFFIKQKSVFLHEKNFDEIKESLEKIKKMYQWE
jgi:hypothetical protein